MPISHKETVTASAGETTNWIPLNQHAVPFNVAFGVLVSGTAFEPTFKVEHTFDDVLDQTSAADVFTHSDVTAGTATIDGNYAFPVAAVRLHVTAVSGTGSIRWHVRQAG